MRVILLVQATGPCIRQRGSEVVFRPDQIRLKEAHFIRGYDFENRGDKFCRITEENAAELLSVTPITRISSEAWAHPWGASIPTAGHTLDLSGVHRDGDHAAAAGEP